MFLSAYRFRGEPTALAACHARLLQLIPPSNLHLHASVPHPGGLDVYDCCPTREVFEAFANGPGFAAALAQAGLPRPAIEPLGELGCLVVRGQRMI
jgi:hypothetical protein